jgi:plastocyanin
MRKLAIVVAVSAAVAAGLLPAGADTRTVEIPGRSFQPAQLRVFVGDTVRWVNVDNSRHSVSANTSAQAQGESFDSGANCPGGLLFRNCLEPGESFSHTFTRVGTFTYRCRIHGSDTSFAACRMCGQVLVRERPTEPTIAPTTAGPTSTGTATTSTSPSVTASGTPTATGSSPIASGSPPDGDSSLPVIPIAAGAVLLLGASAFFVYRSMLKS